MTDTSSPISTGGAGVTFEQHLGAYVLSHLLAKTPLGILHLGTPTTVRFQQKDLSSVDDLIIEGRAGHSKKTVSVAARITPKFIPSDAATVKLFASILAAFQQHEEEITSGRWSLAIVSQNSTHVDEFEQLTQIARAQKNEFEFEKAVANRSKSIQSRYSHVVEVIAAARSALGSYPGTWRLLKHLYVMPAAFEAPATTTALAHHVLNLGCHDLNLYKPTTDLFHVLIQISAELAKAAGTADRDWLIERLTHDGYLATIKTAATTTADLGPFRRYVYQQAQTLAEQSCFTPMTFGDAVRAQRTADLLSRVPADIKKLETASRILDLHAKRTALAELTGELLTSVKAARSVLQETQSVFTEYFEGKGWDRRHSPERAAALSDRLEDLYVNGADIINAAVQAALDVRDEIETNHHIDTFDIGVPNPLAAAPKGLPTASPVMAIPGIPPSSNIADRSIPNRTPNTPANWSVEQGKDSFALRVTNTGNGDATFISLEPVSSDCNIDGADSWRSIPAGHYAEFRLVSPRLDFEGIHFRIRWDDGLQLGRERVVTVVKV